MKPLDLDPSVNYRATVGAPKVDIPEWKKSLASFGLERSTWVRA